MPSRTSRPRPSSRRPSPARGRREGRARRRRNPLWRWRRLLFLLALLLVAGLAGSGYVLSQVPLPPAQFQAETTFLFDARGNRLAVLHAGEHRVNVALDEVPTVVVDAVVAAEDRDFFRHGGIDPVAIVRATVADIRSQSISQGGSTITQQYVKNVYVGRERTLVRKLREAVIAVKLEQRLEKEEILERYLNTIYLGRGAYGVQAAARAYFGLDVEQLGLREAAYLAALIRAPEETEVERDSELAHRRRDSVLAAMVEEGKITAAEAAEVRATSLESYVEPRVPPETVVAGVDAGVEYFVEYVRRGLSARYGDQAVFGGGMRVHTTLDLALQRHAYEAVWGTLDRPDDPSGALVAIDANGRIRAMVGGRDWDASKVNLAVGVAGGGSGRQAGSAFKPFVLAEMLNQGYSVESAFEAPATVVLPGANGGRDWRVSNYGNRNFGQINMLEATRVSSNTAYAQLVLAVGPENAARLAHRMGITSELQAVPSLVLGTQDVSALDMASAYVTFATRGLHPETTVVNRVTAADGTVLEEHEPQHERVLEPEVADVVNFALRQVVERGTGTRARVPGHEIAGKTGTTQNYGDAWFVGYTPHLSVAVWVGYPEGQERDMRNVHGIRVSGGSIPAMIFHRFMEQALTGAEPARFARPSGFGGQVLNRKVEFEDPNATTTTAPEETTTTTGPDPTTTSSSTSSTSTSSTSSTSTSSTSSTSTSSTSSSTSSTTSTSSTSSTTTSSVVPSDDDG